jgi:hypothetical protein
MNRHKPKLAPDLAKRAERLTATIATLKLKIQQIFDQGEVAPKGCYVARYQVRQRQKVYWYYKLQATNEIFEQTKDRKKKSKYKHLGRAGSEEHIAAVVQVFRRTQIDEIERTINSLTNSLLDLCYDGESETIPEKRD